MTLDDQELGMTLLYSLTDKFRPLIIALEAVGEENLSLKKVKSVAERF